MSWRLLSPQQVQQLPDPRWLVHRLILEQGFTILFGPPGVGKSFVALDLACRLATHTKFLGQFTRRTQTVYVAAEGLYTFKRREAAWQEQYGALAASSVWHLGEAVQLHQPTQVQALITLVRHHAPDAGLVIFDTPARCSTGCAENKSEDMSRVVGGVDMIRRTLGAAVLLVHHSQRINDTDDPPASPHARGHSSLDGAADTMLCLTGTPAMLSLACTKQKHDEALFPIACAIKNGVISR